MKDVIIVGGGISAHTAAIYTSRAGMSTLVLSAPEPDQLSYTSDVENFPGFPEGIKGMELVLNAKKQAQKFGSEYIMKDFVDSIKIKEDGRFELFIKDQKFEAYSVIISTGAAARRLDIPGEEEYFGKGVSSCATCDAAFYKDKTAIVVGGGDSAMEDALVLSKFAKKIYIIHRRDKLRASKIMQERVLGMKDKIEMKWNSIPLEVISKDNKVIGLKIKNVISGDESIVESDGIFLAIGHIPNTKFLKGKIDLDEQGYIITDKLGKTNIPGLFAAGDCQDPVFRQAITSAGTGCMAALNSERFIENLKSERKYE
jgi:thioredoxin reductase (NADPH)